MLPERETIYADLVNSLAPSIHGYEDVKLALLLQLFSGVTKHLPDDTRIRGDIHTLIVGSPSTGKTQLLKAFANVAQHALYVDAGNSTGVGLTTAAVRTSGGRNAWELEAGPLTLADNGFAALDSLDSLSAEDQQKLREPLEHQQISSSKGDNTTSLTARTSVLAAANPKYGQWDEYEPLGDQLGIIPGILSKFDLIFLTTDWNQDSDDRALADAILRTSQAGELLARKEHGDTHEIDVDVIDDVTPPIDPGLLGAYAAYARRNCYPAVSEEARRELEDFYVNLRERTRDVDIPLPVTAMKLEALVRLAEASARVRLSDTIMIEDVNRVTDLVKQSLGIFDLGNSNRNSSESDESEELSDEPLTDTEKTKQVRSLIADLEDEKSEGAPVEDVLSLAVQRNIYPGVDRSRVEHQIEKLKKMGEVYEPSTDYLRTT